jgi:hypothetical protein
VDSLRTKLIMTSYWMAMYPVISQDRKIIIMKNYYKDLKIFTNERRINFLLKKSFYY